MRLFILVLVVFSIKQAGYESKSALRWTVRGEKMRRKTKIVTTKESSIRLVKKSLRNLGCDDLFQSFLIVLKHRPARFRLINISNKGVNSPMLWHNSVSLIDWAWITFGIWDFSKNIPRIQIVVMCVGQPKKFTSLRLSQHGVISVIISTWPMLKAINSHTSLAVIPQCLTETPLILSV